MKLSVVKVKEIQNDFVSKVAEYANTQNKVNKSDFFSNSPFHKDFKDYSNRIWIAAMGGTQKRTHWFYERVRGEYLNEQAYLTLSKKKQFQIENPKNQVIDKTFLSKSENAWLQKPDIVAKGAQYSFSSFAETITDQLEEDKQVITENYFKEAVARVILFRSVERLVSKASWYDGGYRAQTVAYTVSYLSYIIEKSGKYLNFKLIWDSQEIPEDLVLLLEEISGKVYKKLTHPKEGYANVTQWAKTSKCWEDIKKIESRLSLDDSILVEKEERKYIEKNDKYIKKIDTGIDKQVAVYKVKPKTWHNLYEYYKKYETDHNLSTMQMDILIKMAKGILKTPSEKQSIILYNLLTEARDEGFQP